MTKSEAIEYFGTAANLARELGIDRSAITNWPDPPPPGRQAQIEILTGGELRADAIISRNRIKKVNRLAR